MNIGIDARPLATRRAGIGNYVFNNLKELYKIDKENQYYLYSNKDFSLPFPENAQWKKCIYPQKIGTLWYYGYLPEILNKDRVETFWGTQHVLPFGNKNLKYILTIHDLAIFYYPQVSSFLNYIVNRLMLPYSAKKATHIISVSKSTADDTVKLLGIKRDKIKVIYEAAEDSYTVRDIKKCKQIMSDKYGIHGEYILYLGTLEPRKGIDTLIKAYEKCIVKNKTGHKLVIAGAPGWKYSSIFELVNELNINEFVIFPGYIKDEDMTALFNAASLFVFPSIYEGFGLPVLEAMRCSLPVITTNVSSLPEVGGDAAVYVNPNDVDELGECMLNIICDYKYNKFLREKSITQAEKFNWSNSAKETLEILLK